MADKNGSTPPAAGTPPTETKRRPGRKAQPLTVLRLMAGGDGKDKTWVEQPLAVKGKTVAQITAALKDAKIQGQYVIIRFVKPVTIKVETKEVVTAE